MKAFDRNVLPDLNVFLTIVRRRNMSQAAIELGVTTSALSHRLRKLEAQLGVRLLNRTSRSITPSDAGAALAARLETSFDGIADALAELQIHRERPVGRLRLNVLKDAARLILEPALPQYFSLFPQMHLDIVVDDRFVDIVSEGYDAGIRYGDRVAQDMIGVALTGPQEWIVVGSPSVIGRYGRPEQPHDLLGKPCIRMRVGDNSNFPWELGSGDEMVKIDVDGPMTANETDQQVNAAILGIGFGYCLAERVKTEVATGALEIVLREWKSEGPPFMIYYPSRRQLPTGLRELIDLIRSASGLAPLRA